METTKLGKDEFAKWFYNQAIINIEMYMFDTFYDIEFIMESNKNCIKVEVGGSYPTDKPIYNTLFWMHRKTGSYIVREGEESNYMKHNTTVYKLTFCINSDYFRDEEYVTIERIK